MKGVPEELDRAVRIVLAYRPKPKTKAAQKQNRKRLKIEKDKANPPSGGCGDGGKIFGL